MFNFNIHSCLYKCWIHWYFLLSVIPLIKNKITLTTLQIIFRSASQANWLLFHVHLFKDPINWAAFVGGSEANSPISQKYTFFTLDVTFWLQPHILIFNLGWKVCHGFDYNIITDAFISMEM